MPLHTSLLSSPISSYNGVAAGKKICPKFEKLGYFFNSCIYKNGLGNARQGRKIEFFFIVGKKLL
jgi:hypothetical protein